MNVSYNWLQQYVAIPWSVEELAERLTLAGMEVESVSSADPGVSSIIVGEIKEVQRHPDADGLTVSVVHTGGEDLTIVAGAPNVRQGIKVPVAPVGTALPNGQLIEAADLRGVQSFGMMCSEQELGLSDDHTGIMELPQQSKVGQSLSEVLGLDDWIMDIAIYANRPDCMSMLGMAREVAALTGSSITYPSIETVEDVHAVTEKLGLRVEDSDLCPRYMARVIEGIEVGPSPLWIESRLRAAGMRPINNVVDITNFVMLEMGQPLHAFDYDRLSGPEIVVRRARPGETLLTLDGQERNLDEEMLMICDAEKPVCIGGVMGGANSEVTANTTALVLESANFSAANIRKTARRLGIASEASSRFEKGLDPSGTELAMERAAELLRKYAGGRVAEGVLDDHAAASKAVDILVRPKEVERLLGIAVPTESVHSILSALEFQVEEQTNGDLQVTVAPFRTDIELECDVIEEIARHHGFHRIPQTLPASGAEPGGRTDRQQAVDALTGLLTGLGLQEAINYTFVHPQSMYRLGWDEREFGGLVLENPISEDQAVMRLSLVPGLLEALARNHSRQQSNASLFEIGSVYIPEDPGMERQPREDLRLAVAMMGQRNPRHWSHSNSELDFYDIKGIMESIVNQFELEELSWKRTQCPWLHPGRSVEIQLQGRWVALFGQIHPQTASVYRVPKTVLVGELNLAAIIDHFGRRLAVSALPRFPAVDRDLALLLDEKVPVGQVLAALQEAGGEILDDAWVFDVYHGEQVPDGCKSAAFSLRFQADRTLTDEEVQEAMDKILYAAKEQFNAEIR